MTKIDVGGGGASTGDKPGRGRIYASILDTIGDTPLVRLPKLSARFNAKAEVLAKLEFFNPLSSVKDRIGLSMIEAAERAGKVGPNTTIVECSTKGSLLVQVD